jgi:hypothetical protein
VGEVGLVYAVLSAMILEEQFHAAQRGMEEELLA